MTEDLAAAYHGPQCHCGCGLRNLVDGPEARAETLAVIHRRAHMARAQKVTEDRTDKRPEVRFQIGFCKPGCTVPLFLGPVHSGPCVMASK